jgi:peptide/nickel transport system permease protein
MRLPFATHRRFKDPKARRNLFAVRGQGTISLAAGLLVVAMLAILPIFGRILIAPGFYQDILQTRDGFKFRPPSMFRDDCINGPAGPNTAPPQKTGEEPKGRIPTTSTELEKSYDLASCSNLPLCGAILGTDWRGTRVDWRLIHGMEFVWMWGMPCAASALILGLLWGVAISWWSPPRFPGHHAVIGGWRSWLGRGLAGAFDLLDLFPRIMLLLLITTIHGITLFKFSLAVGIILTLQVAAGVRQRSGALRRSDTVAAAEELGLPPLRVVWKHIVWHHLRGYALSQFAFAIGAFVLWDATMGFLGYGTADHNTWGLIIREGVRHSVPWMIWPASVVTVVTALSLFKLSDGAEKWKIPQ